MSLDKVVAWGECGLDYFEARLQVLRGLGPLGFRVEDSGVRGQGFRSLGLGLEDRVQGLYTD